MQLVLLNTAHDERTLRSRRCSSVLVEVMLGSVTKTMTIVRRSNRVFFTDGAKKYRLEKVVTKAGNNLVCLVKEVQ